jgi:hypothetical protein
MTATPRPYRASSGWAVAALRRVVGTVRYVNDELSRASEAMIRSARSPQPGPQTSRRAGGRSAAAGTLAAPEQQSAKSVAVSGGTEKAA